MTDFRTVIPTIKQEHQIDYNSKIVLLGSCFTEHISQKLDYFKFDTLTNPFGIVFNSSALKTAVKHCVTNKTYTLSDLQQNNGLWFSFNHHSQFSSSDSKDTLININAEITEAHQFIKDATHIVITLGTAWVYTNNASSEIVANCHKIPQQNFKKSLQSISDIINDLDTIYNDIKTMNPNISFLFTISPVRHLRNGFAENMLSKAHLISAVQTHIAEKSDCFYIPAYEIMMDDLRDYRFYDIDMIHPNATAINYIWDYFKTSWISDKSNPIMKAVDAIQKDLLHHPFNKNTEAFQQFQSQLDKKIAALAAINPNIKF